MNVPSVLLASIETTVNAALHLDPDSLTRVAALSGTCIAIELRGLNSCFYIRPAANGILLDASSEQPPNTTLSGTPLSLLQMIATPTDSRLLIGGDVQLCGDIELGRHFKALIQDLDLDWEELLSRYVGDILARPMGNSIRSFKAWGQQTTKILGQNLAEYLREEIQLLPSRGEVVTFLDSVDQLRADLNRLEARIQRLHRQL